LRGAKRRFGRIYCNLQDSGPVGGGAEGGWRGAPSREGIPDRLAIRANIVAMGGNTAWTEKSGARARNLYKRAIRGYLARGIKSGDRPGRHPGSAAVFNGLYAHKIKENSDVDHG